MPEKLKKRWQLMLNRCTNPKNPDYKRYGGRGITVCKEWLDYETFKQWALQNGYKEHLTIERKDNNSGYFPANCHFVPKLKQSWNRRNNTMLTYKGRTVCLTQLAREHGIKRTTLVSRLRRGWTIEKALETPTKRS